MLVLDSIYHTHLVAGRYLPGQYTSFLSDEGNSGGVRLGVMVSYFDAGRILSRCVRTQLFTTAAVSSAEQWLALFFF